jgi:hypothetical protein
MRHFGTVIVAALFVASYAPAAHAAPCKDAKGKFIKCPPAKPMKCKGANGKFAKCGTPGAKPIK